jgi:hypothetical protein
VVKGCMRFLGITWAELVEEGVEDRWSGESDEFRVNLLLDIS